MLEIAVVVERCVNCGDCVNLCPQSGDEAASPVLTMAESGAVEVAEAAGCIGCFTCVEFCRAAAITISGVPAPANGQPDVYPTRPVSRII